tara:strand:+ start:7141 stop:7404 length:264 start_codon:yes stop_codon:yes gene_type:complete
MAKQYKIVSAKASSTNIIVSVAYKRDTDIDAARSENVAYAQGTTSESIKADLENRASRIIDWYENDIIACQVLENTLGWQTVVKSDA